MLTTDPRAVTRPASQSLGISGSRSLLINHQGRIHHSHSTSQVTEPQETAQDPQDSDDGLVMRGSESMEIDDSSQVCHQLISDTMCLF